jgi:hypothetical protein
MTGLELAIIGGAGMAGFFGSYRVRQQTPIVQVLHRYPYLTL